MKKILKWIAFVIVPLIGVALIETIIKGGLDSALHWILSYKKMFLISVGIYLSLQFVILALMNNVYLTVFTTFIIWIIAAVVNFYKVEMMGDPVLPWDFLYINQLFDLIPALYKNVNLVLLISGAIIAIVIFGLMIKYTAFKTFKWPVRVGIFLIGIVPFFLIYNYEDNFVGKVITDAGVTNIPWNQVETQKKNGMMLGFIVNIPNIRVDKPEGYSKEEMEDISLQVDQTLINESYMTSDIKPNVIMIMSEAFWELSNLNISLDGQSINPTVDANKIGQIVSPRYGGGTSNVEFEALTGFSMVNLPGGAIPYQQYMGKDIPSLAWTFKEYGYNTTAIHTYYKYFWNRIQAYESLGFDEFIGLDDLQDPPFYGSLYVDDQVITDEILNTIKESEEPSFIYSVTMQNHGLYNDNRYGENTINEVTEYSDTTNQILNNLVTGFKHSDDMLAELIAEVEKLDEPTLIVFFGDHLPSMNEVYEETGYVSSMVAKTLEEELKMKETPLVVWNNYGQGLDQIGSISTTFLPPLVMQWAQLPGNGYYSVLEEMRKSIPAYTSLVKQLSDGTIQLETPTEYLELEHIYQMIQYDMMFGEEYSDSTLFELMSEGKK